MNKIKTIIDRFEGDKAVLRIAGEDIIVPKKYLLNFKEGDTVHVLFANDEEDTKNSQAVAEELLRQVFKE